MVAHHHKEEWTEENCNKRHRPLTLMSTTVLAMLSGLIALTVFTMTWQMSVATKADDATRAIEVEMVRASDYRDKVKDDFTSIKSWLTRISDKQDKLNDNMQRVLTKTEPASKAQP